MTNGQFLSFRVLFTVRYSSFSAMNWQTWQCTPQSKGVKRWQSQLIRSDVWLHPLWWYRQRKTWGRWWWCERLWWSYPRTCEGDPSTVSERGVRRGRWIPPREEETTAHIPWIHLIVQILGTVKEFSYRFHTYDACKGKPSNRLDSCVPTSSVIITGIQTTEFVQITRREKLRARFFIARQDPDDHRDTTEVEQDENNHGNANSGATAGGKGIRGEDGEREIREHEETNRGVENAITSERLHTWGCNPEKEKEKLFCSFCHVFLICFSNKSGKRDKMNKTIFRKIGTTWQYFLPISLQYFLWILSVFALSFTMAKKIHVMIKIMANQNKDPRKISSG